MKYLQSKIALSIVLLALTTLLVSCKKEVTSRIGYKGFWVHHEVNEEGLETRVDAIFNYYSFDIRVYEQEFVRGPLVNTQIQKGYLSDDSRMALVLTEVSNLEDDNKMVTYKKGDPLFDIVVSGPRNFNCYSYRIEGNKLILTSLAEEIPPIIFIQQ